MDHADHWHMLLTQVLRRPHVPQLRVPPQPSEALPQWNPSWAHVLGVQAAAQTLFAHAWPAAHVPQLRVPPQPSEALPQLNPSWAHVFGVQAAAQTLFVQVWPAAHVPQLRVPPQPSKALPQLNPSWAHVFGMQAPGLMVRFALAELLLQLADAATVTWSWALTAEVDSFTVALLAPTGTVTVPVQAGDPVQPGKVAI
jgi:hypothetical protein